MLRTSLFTNAGRQKSVAVGKMGGNQPTDCRVIAGWGIMHARLAKTARLWTYHTDNFLKLKEKMGHKDSKTPSSIITRWYGRRRVRDLDFLTVWFPQKQFWSQIVRSSQDRGSFNGQSPPPHALRSPERGLDRHGLRSLKQGKQRKTANQTVRWLKLILKQWPLNPSGILHSFPLLLGSRAAQSQNNPTWQTWERDLLELCRVWTGVAFPEKDWQDAAVETSMASTEPTLSRDAPDALERLIELQ